MRGILSLSVFLVDDIVSGLRRLPEPPGLEVFRALGGIGLDGFSWDA